MPQPAVQEHVRDDCPRTNQREPRDKGEHVRDPWQAELQEERAKVGDQQASNDRRHRSAVGGGCALDRAGALKSMEAKMTSKVEDLADDCASGSTRRRRLRGAQLNRETNRFDPRTQEVLLQ